VFEQQDQDPEGLLAEAKAGTVFAQLSGANIQFEWPKTESACPPGESNQPRLVTKPESSTRLARLPRDSKSYTINNVRVYPEITRRLSAAS